MIATEDSNRTARVERHDAATVAHVDHVGRLIDDHDDGGAGARPLGADLLAGHGLLTAVLGGFDQ